jgi:hypothetical protein
MAISSALSIAFSPARTIGTTSWKAPNTLTPTAVVALVGSISIQYIRYVRLVVGADSNSLAFRSKVTQ